MRNRDEFQLFMINLIYLDLHYICSMHLYYPISILMLVLFSCGEYSRDEHKTPEVVKIVNKKKPEKLKKEKAKNFITNDNVVARLIDYGKKNPETIADIFTTKGKIRIRLYNDTPLHRANFILMAKKKYFDGTIFTRVKKGFIAQGGGAYDEKNTKIRGNIGKYTIPAEFLKKRFHKQGAIAAARRYEDNPEKRSDQSAFCFVEGTIFNEFTLDQYEEINGYHYDQAQRTYYLNHPGAAHIDGEHTVFGEIINGYSVVPKITEVHTDSKDWPKEDIFIDSVIIIK